MMEYNLCNGTVGIVTHVDKQSETVRVAFVTQGQLIDIVLRPISAYFIVSYKKTVSVTELFCPDHP